MSQSRTKSTKITAATAVRNAREVQVLNGAAVRHNRTMADQPMSRDELHEIMLRDSGLGGFETTESVHVGDGYEMCNGEAFAQGHFITLPDLFAGHLTKPIRSGPFASISAAD